MYIMCMCIVENTVHILSDLVSPGTPTHLFYTDDDRLLLGLRGGLEHTPIKLMSRVHMNEGERNIHIQIHTCEVPVHIL